MKAKMFRLFLGLTLMATLTMFSSCDKDDMDEMELTGDWWSVDDPYDVIRLNLGSNNIGTCYETWYDRFGRAVDMTSDLFDWTVKHREIHIYFRTGSRGHWIWDYALYNGHTVEINGRLFSRDRNYYRSPKYVGSPELEKETAN